MTVFAVLMGVGFFCFFGSCFGSYLANLTIMWVRDVREQRQPTRRL